MLKKNRKLKSLALCLGLGYSAMSLGNSFALDLESKVKNAQEYCLKRMQESGENLVFNINDNTVEISKHKEDSYDVFINGESIKTFSFGSNANTGDIGIGLYSPIELKGITKSNWRLEQLSISRGGNVEARIIDGKESFEIIYLGRFNKSDCSFKKNPDDATKRLIIWDPDSSESFYISYPELGGRLYFNAEETPYTIDVLGTIRNTLFPSRNRVIGNLTDILRKGFLEEMGSTWIASSKEILQDLGSRFSDGKGESDFVYLKISDPKFFPEEDMNYGSHLAIPRNFGSGEVFWVKRFENKEPTLMSTPYRISADGVISDTREKVTLKEGIQVPKPIAVVRFTVIWSRRHRVDYSNVVGSLINLEDIKNVQ